MAYVLLCNTRFRKTSNLIISSIYLFFYFIPLFFATFIFFQDILKYLGLQVVVSLVVVAWTGPLLFTVSLMFCRSS